MRKIWALQRHIWSTFVTVLWSCIVVKETRHYRRDWDIGSCESVLLVWYDVKTYWQFFFKIFFKNALESSYNFNPIEITWRKIDCWAPVSMATWSLHTLWRFTVPAYSLTECTLHGDCQVNWFTLCLLRTTNWNAHNTKPMVIHYSQPGV